MIVKTLDDYRALRTRRANVLARPAADAGRLIHLKRAANDIKRLDGAITHTCRTVNPVRSSDAKILLPDGMPQMQMAPIRRSHLKRACRTNGSALVIARNVSITVCKIKLGLTKCL